MTTLEFAKKCLAKSRLDLERIKRRPVARKDELAALNDKVKHYEEIVRYMEEKEKCRQRMKTE